MSTYDVDVLVVGAGPVGLTAASCLARAGVSVRLVDAAAGPATTSRALAAQSRGLEIYDQLGVLGEIAPHGTRVNAFVRHTPDGTTRLDFPFHHFRTRFPFSLNIDQVVIERVLRAHVASHGVELEWGTALESFEQDDDGVTAVLRRADGEPVNPVRARYLWGCDGGRSTVRKSLGLPLEGESTPNTWLIADAVVHADEDRDGTHWTLPPGGPVMMFPFPDVDKWRVLDTTGTGDPEDPAQVARQLSEKLTAGLGYETTVEEPTWISRFTVQQRAVPAMHVGRCFVAGDAAHVHSPASGQGLNTGVQDAYNLAWKLAMVVHGDAETSLLDTYDAERVPVGQALLASTGEVTQTALRSGPGGPPASIPDAGSDFERRLVENMSGLGIAYRDSDLSVPASGAGRGPGPGERLTQVGAEDAQSPGWTVLRSVLRCPSWHLLEFVDGVGGGPGSNAAPLPTWVDRVPVARDRAVVDDAPGAVHTVPDADGRVHETLGASDGEWILVRPDGYVSARGAGPEALDDALAHLTRRHLRGVSAA